MPIPKFVLKKKKNYFEQQFNKNQIPKRDKNKQGCKNNNSNTPSIPNSGEKHIHKTLKRGKTRKYKIQFFFPMN